MLNILWRNLKWRLQNPVSIVVSLIQPLVWLVLYRAVASQTMQNIKITNYTAFMLPGIIVLVTFATCCSSGMLNFIMRSNGSFYRILIAPVRRSSIVLGQMFEAMIVAFLEIAVLWIVSLGYAVHVASGFAGIALMIFLNFLAVFFVAGITYTLSLLLPNEMVYETIMNAIVLPAFFLSTALFPLESLSGGMKRIILLNPFTHLINALRSLIVEKTLIPGELLMVILLFITLSCVSFALACLKLHKTTSC